MSSVVKTIKLLTSWTVGILIHQTEWIVFPPEFGSQVKNSRLPSWPEENLRGKSV